MGDLLINKGPITRFLVGVPTRSEIKVGVGEVGGGVDED